MATRRTNKRKQRNRGRFGFLYKLVSILLILVVVMAGCVVFFRVDDIVVAGQTQYTAEEIIAVSGIEKGDNLFALNKFEAARNILVALPYVDEVAIRRTLPDGLVISVSECHPVLLVKGEPSWWVVDAKGKLLEEVATSTHPGTATVTGLTALLPAAGTPLVVDTEQDAKLSSVLELVAALEGRGMMGKVSAVDLTGTTRILFTYDNRFEVTVPMTADFAWKVKALEEIIGKLQPNESGKINMLQEKECIFSPE